MVKRLLFALIVITISFFADPAWPKDGTFINLNKVSIPKRFGKVREFYQPPHLQKRDSKIIFHIQDVHANYEAQKNLANILEYLIKNYGLSVILVEGGITDKDFSYIREWASLKERKKKAGELLKEGVITGETYLDIATDLPLKFQGIEDRDLYEENMEAYLKISTFREEALGRIQKFKDAAGALKRYIYTRRLKEFDEVMIDYKSDKIELEEYLGYLDDLALKAGIDLERFRNYTLLLKTANLEKEINFKIVERERDKLIKKLNDILIKEDIKEMLMMSLKFNENKISPGGFYSYLRNLSMQNKVSMKKFKNIDRYVDYIANYEKIESDELFKDIDQIEIVLLDALCKSEEERTLFDISHDLSVLEAFLKLKFAPEDLDYYKNNREDFNLENWSKFLGRHTRRLRLDLTIPEDRSVIDKNLSFLEAFYDAAFKRDEAFLKNSLRKMEREGADIAVLITGGFHTKNLTRLFMSNSISYLVLAPRFTKKTDDLFYDRTLRESYRTRTWDDK